MKKTSQKKGKVYKPGFEPGTLAIRDNAPPLSYPDGTRPDTIHSLVGIRSANPEAYRLKTLHMDSQGSKPIAKVPSV